MDHILDKAIVFMLCCGLMVLTGVTALTIIGMLAAAILSALFELSALPRWARILCPLLFCLLTMLFPSLVVFLPLAASDLFRARHPWLRAVWLTPLVVVAIAPERLAIEAPLLFGVALLSALSCLLSWRATRAVLEREAARTERDGFERALHYQELRNNDLRDRRELELKVSTLNERSRIAREIHDNVGHLLTRSVLQVKALVVTYAHDRQLAGELEQVGDTLDTAFETVRASVHELHKEAFSLPAQLDALARMDEALEVKIEYRAEELPPQVAYAFLTVVREALSNSRRHSDATGVLVSVVEFPGLYQLTVHDNGSNGSSQAAGKGSAGIGLTTMEERARALGGFFRISCDKGFKILVSIPKARAEQACAS